MIRVLVWNEFAHEKTNETVKAIYPDGMHGYYSYQGIHFLLANRDFWLHHLLDK